MDSRANGRCTRIGRGGVAAAALSARDPVRPPAGPRTASALSIGHPAGNGTLGGASGVFGEWVDVTGGEREKECVMRAPFPSP